MWYNVGENGDRQEAEKMKTLTRFVLLVTMFIVGFALIAGAFAPIVSRALSLIAILP